MLHFHLKKPFIFLLVILIILLIPMEAYVSGSFGEFYGEKNYLVSYDNQRHKIYTRDTDVDALYREFQKEFFADITSKTERINRLLEDAKKKGIPLINIDLELPNLEVKNNAELSMVSRASYPLIINFPIERQNRGGIYNFMFALSSSIKKTDGKWFLEQLHNLFVSSSNSEVLSDKIKPEQYKLPKVTVFKTNYALYAGGHFKTKGEVTLYYKEQLLIIMNTVAPVVEKYAGQANFEKDVKIKVFPIAEALKKSKRSESSAFNPLGPIHDHGKGVDFFRPRYGNQNFMVTALFAVPKDNWGDLGNNITILLKQNLVSETDQMRSFRIDTLLIKLKAERINSRVFYDLRNYKDNRVAEALVEFIHQAERSNSDKRSALDTLTKLVGEKTSDKIVNSITSFYNNNQINDSMQKDVLLLLGAIHTEVSASNIIEIYKKSSTADTGDPYFVRQEMFRALENIGKPAIEPLKKALKDKIIENDKKRVKEIRKVIETIETP
ncbi:MAG: hypothetical protein GY714_09560 [Desulfobacterales bacterium]|nr:hypothetical protein [Desulfobacterales bacterium]MCP4161157.1 hypothetical protein [Deltaproteobacteria bacterium]